MKNIIECGICNEQVAEQDGFRFYQSMKTAEHFNKLQEHMSKNPGHVYFMVFGIFGKRLGKIKIKSVFCGRETTDF